MIQQHVYSRNMEESDAKTPGADSQPERRGTRNSGPGVSQPIFRALPQDAFGAIHRDQSNQQDYHT